MKLQSLRMKNVKCFDDGEVNLASGKSVIIGRNGSGKSTILQSILYSLYSDFQQGNLDEFIRLGKDAAEFELDFEHNGQEYTAQRIIRTSGTNEAYLITRPQEDTIAEKQTAVTEEIAEILDIKKEIFRDVILVSQGEIAEIIGMRDSERKDLRQTARPPRIRQGLGQLQKNSVTSGVRHQAIKGGYRCLRETRLET